MRGNHHSALLLLRSTQIKRLFHGVSVNSLSKISPAASLHRLQGLKQHQPWIKPLQTRSYVFVPTTWDEWKRVFFPRSKRRTIQVKLFQEQQQEQSQVLESSSPSSQWMTSAKLQLQRQYIKSPGRLERWMRAKHRRAKIRANSLFSSSAIFLQKKAHLQSRAKTTALQWRDDSKAVARRWREHGRVTARRWQEKMRQMMYTRHIPLIQQRTLLLKHLQQQQQKNSNTMTTIAAPVIQSVTLTEYSQADWFDADGYPLTSRDGDRFVNPWMSESTNGIKSLQSIWKWRTQRLQRILRELRWRTLIPSIQWPWSSSYNNNNNKILPHFVSPSAASSPSPPISDRIRLTWIGHSTCLVEMAGVTVLTDPMFSHRASPLQYLPVGVPRHTPPACSVEDLPAVIDICLISHDHYDHLDKNSVKQLRSRVHLWVVPLGIKDWLLHHCQVAPERIVELEWWESVALFQRQQHSSSSTTTPSSSSSSSHTPKLQVGGTFHWPYKMADTTPDFQITCAPTQHWSCRSMWDRNTRLWCSWALYDHQQGSSFYFGGDSGYPQEFPLFRQIGQRLGPFDLSALPIGAYEPNYFMKDAHVHPAEALQIHNDIQSKRSVGIHWGSFALAEEDNDEPPRKLRQAISKTNDDDQQPPSQVDFQVIGMGDSIESEPRTRE